MDDVVMRRAVAGDRVVLDAMLVETVNWHPGRPARIAADVLGDPALVRYVEDWPRPDDFGVVAVSGGSDVGAAWCRRFAARAPGYGFVDEHTPEVSIAVAAPCRGLGIGTALLLGLTRAARRQGVGALSLSVERGNPARRLYERVGFGEVGGGRDAAVMLLDLGVR
jgi:GNAT superfamily N-acetyltransferase